MAFQYDTGSSVGIDWDKLMGKKPAPTTPAGATNGTAMAPTTPKPPTMGTYTPGAQVSARGLDAARNDYFDTGRKTTEGNPIYNLGGSFLSPDKLNEIGFYKDQGLNATDQTYNNTQSELDKGYGITDNFVKQNLNPLYAQNYAAEDYLKKNFGLGSTTNYNGFGGLSSRNSLMSNPIQGTVPQYGAPATGTAGTQPTGTQPVQGAQPVQGVQPIQSLSGSQQSAQDWINNAASGQGGMATYVAQELKRYNDAIQARDKGTVDKIIADSQRVGYALPNIVNQEDQSITEAADSELAAKKAKIKAETDAGIQARQKGITDYTNALNEGLGKLDKTKAVEDQGAQELQNRRGGFYSGGLDYQLGGIASSINEARGGLQRDYGSRISDLQGQNTLASSQAAETIARLDAEQPGLIKSKIQEALAAKAAGEAAARKQAGEDDIKRGTLTGYLPDYNSYDVAKVQEQMAKNSAAYASASPEEQQRLHAENVALAASIGGKDLTGSGDYGFSQGTQTIAGRNQDLNETKTMAELTGYLPDGTPTSAQQKQQLAEEWTVSKNTGVITNTLADLYGIPRGTKTQDAIKQAADISVAQQNANTSSRNADISSARESRLAKGDTGGTGGTGGGAKVSAAQFNDVYETLNKKYGVASYDDSGKVSYHNTTNPDQQALIVIDVLDAGMNDDQTLQLLNKLGITEAEAHKLLGG